VRTAERLLQAAVPCVTNVTSLKSWKNVPHFVRSRAVSDALPRATPSKSSSFFKLEES
jgi:hypothetical protein